MRWLAVAVLRALLYGAPPAFRREYGAEIVAHFRRSLAASGGPGVFRTVGRGWWGAVQVAVLEWRDRTGGRARREDRLEGRGGMGRGLWVAAQQAVRSVVRTPGFSLGVFGLFGLGIGATVTVFSLVDGVLIRTPPYPEAERIVMVDEGAHTWPDFLDWRETVPAFDAVVAGSSFSLTLTEEVPEHVEGARVSSGFFEFFGATTVLGRLPSDAELEAGTRVAVVSHAAWERRWGGSPDIIGRSLTIDGAPAEVVGVLRPDFLHPGLISGFADLYLPVESSLDLTRGSRSWTVMARLAEGATLEQAREGLHARARVFAEIAPARYLDDAGRLRRTFPPVPLREAITGDAQAPLLILLAGAGLLLLVAVGNASSLLLARGEARQREIAVRRALGAGRSVQAQLLFESVGMSVGGGLIGLAAAGAGLRLVQAFEPGDLPRIGDLAIDLRAVAVAMLLAATAGLLAGLVPALRSGRTGPASAMRRSGQRGATGRTGKALVIAEATLASLLLVGSLTVVQGLRGLLDVDPGFEAARAHLVTVDLGVSASDEQRAVTTDLLLRRFAELPGVTGVGAGVRVPFEVSGGSRCCWIGDVSREGRESDVWMHPVTPGYFQALRIGLDSGREFSNEDGPESPPVAILNRAAATELFGDGAAVGEVVRFAEEQDLEVVGVSGDVRHWGADQDIEPAVYVPYVSMGTWASTLRFVLRGGDTPALSALQVEVAAIAPEAIVSSVGTMEGLMSESLASQRFYTMVLSIFAALALVLAMAGLGGTLLYDVRQRRRELGIRVALGQPASSIARAVLVRGLFLVGTGAMIGLAAFWPLRGVMDGVVPGLDSVDPFAMGGFGMLMVASVLLASWAPARVVAATDPADALRGDD